MTTTLLVIFFLYNAGWYLMYMISERQVKQEVKAYVANHPDLADAVFSFDFKNGSVSDPSFEWEEKGKEFVYKGSMYDVVSCVEKDGKLFLKCINDKKEKELKASMAKMNAKSKSKYHFTFSPYSEKTADYSIATPATILPVHNIAKDESLQLLYLPLFAPPPDCI